MLHSAWTALFRARLRVPGPLLTLLPIPPAIPCTLLSSFACMPTALVGLLPNEETLARQLLVPIAFAVALLLF